VNCRILPGVPVATVITQLTKVLADPGIEVSLVDEATPSNPAVLRDDVMTATETIVRSMFPGVPVVPMMSTGATDGLHLRNAGIPTFGVDGLFDDIDDVRAHGRDERVGVKQFNEDVEFHYRLITALSK
jgi:acetylornithine deacetylase/succinyl-diaminopimelate desuccinylase-like protein